MVFYWVSSAKIGSQIIRAGTGQDCSHFAIQCDLPDGPVIFESRLETGVVSVSIDEFKRHYHMQHSLMVRETRPEMETDIYSLLRKKLGARYDAKAISWFSLALLLKRWFGWAPRVNQWQDKAQFFCVEILAGDSLQKLVSIYAGCNIEEANLSITTPHELYELMKSGTNLY